MNLGLSNMSNEGIVTLIVLVRKGPHGLTVILAITYDVISLPPQVVTPLTS